MTKYKIPEPFQPGFKLLKQLDENQLSIFREALENAEIGTSPEKITKSLIGKASLKSNDANSLLSTIFSLVNLKTDIEAGFDEFVTDLVDSYVLIDPSVKKDEQLRLVKNLTILLGADGAIRQTIKATGLQRDNERIFYESRIISDIRLVFDDEMDKPQQSAVIVHNLKIIYQDNNNVNSIFFALDLNDLKQLKETVIRAIEKHRLIREKTFTDISIVDSIEQ